MPLYCASRRTLVNISEDHSQLVADNLKDIEFPPDIDTVICCLGSTIKKAGSKKNFEMSDYQLPMDLFKSALEKGARRLLIVSSQGASSSSSIFYNQIKGKLEDAIGQLGWEQVVIFRPSLLLGERDESRPGEQIGQWLAPLFRYILPNNYRPIRAETLASAIWHYYQEFEPGVQVKEGNQLWIK